MTRGVLNVTRVAMSSRTLVRGAAFITTKASLCRSTATSRAASLRQ